MFGLEMKQNASSKPWCTRSSSLSTQLSSIFHVSSSSFFLINSFSKIIYLSSQVDENTVETEVPPNQRPIAEVFPMNPESQDGVPDHTMMDFLYDANLLHNITVRYMRDDIYSYIAYILIAVNPYKRLPIYEDGIMWQYRKVCECVLFRILDIFLNWKFLDSPFSYRVQWGRFPRMCSR